MANSKDNISKYATSFISFDEVSTEIYDNIGGYMGTLYNAPTKVTGWNGEGYAMSFNGSNQYVRFNNKILKENHSFLSIRFKIKKDSYPSSGISENILSTHGASSEKGLSVEIYDNSLLFFYNDVSTDWANVTYFFICKLESSVFNLCDSQWHDVLLVVDGVGTGKVKIYIDDMENPKATADNNKPLESHINNFTIGASASTAGVYAPLNAQLDQIEIYDRIISPIPDKHLVLHNGQYKYHNGTSWITTTSTEANFIQRGMNDLSHITEAQWAELTGNKSIVVWSDFEDKQYVNAVLEKEPFLAKDIIGENAELVIHSESTVEQLAVTTKTDDYSIYDYISELPTVVAYTESTNDIVVTTTVDPYDMYDEFGNEMEVLLYTDDMAVTEADLILEANWSPVDELEGDFEVVTWSDEPQDTAQRVLELTAIPKPQFVKLANPKRVYGYLDDVVAIDESMSYRDDVRYLFTDNRATKWYVWDFDNKQFVEVDASTHELVLKNGMKHTDIALLTQADWRTWTKEYINIGIFLKDNPRDTIVSVVETLSYEDYLPRDTVELEKANFYILNTTAKIDIELNGNVLKGFLSDDDLTRVQYRVLLNGGNYYPADGSFTNLGEAPQNIELIIGSKDIKIDDWNTIRVEFQDFFGTTDYWATSFLGTYSGLMFKDVYGQYYSSEIGEVLQYLDFGVIIAGQTTIEHEVILKNQYGYDVENVHIYANTSNFPTGLECEFSQAQSPFISHPELRLGGVLKNNEEISFFVRLKTVLGATPDANGSFDIIVKADRVY